MSPDFHIARFHHDFEREGGLKDYFHCRSPRTSFSFPGGSSSEISSFICSDGLERRFRAVFDPPSGDGTTRAGHSQFPCFPQKVKDHFTEFHKKDAYRCIYNAIQYVRPILQSISPSCPHDDSHPKHFPKAAPSERREDSAAV